MNDDTQQRAIQRGKLPRRQVLRAAALFGVGVLGSSLLAACGQSSGTAASTPAGSGAGAAATKPAVAVPTTAATAGSSAVSTPAATAGASSATAGTTAAATTGSAAASPTAGTTGATTGASTTPAAGANAAPQGAGALGYTARMDAKGNITFWHFWGSPVRRNAIRRIVGTFMQLYPGVKVTETFVPFGDIWTKNIAAVAAGSGMPDVIVEDRPQLRTRAKNNIETSLDDLAKRDAINGQQFWPFTWEEAVVEGKPYGLPYETDIRVLYYNKAVMKDSGLDPEQPPKNWDDLWTMADKLDKKTGSKLERVAFFPTFGNMGLDQWAWNNGGEWQDKNNNPTLNAKPNVDTLAWMKKWNDRYGRSEWEAFSGTFGQGNQDGFMTGKVAMKIDIAGYTSFLNFYNPKMETQDKQALGWDVAPVTPAPGQKPASLSGGFALSIPKGSKNMDPAWEFIKYAVYQGQASWARDTYSIPTTEQIAKTDPTLNADPHWKFFIEAMGYGRPAAFNPYYPTFLETLGPARDAVFSGKQQPQEAMDEAQKKVEAEIAKNKK